MTMSGERDFPVGHPKAADYVPASPAAKEWNRVNVHPLGERDFPVGHPKALDTPGNRNDMEWPTGVDPLHPELEAHSGRTPEQAKAVADFNASVAQVVKESPVLEPVIAPDPPIV
jgi:hypothetical protein